MDYLIAEDNISIHAPTRGATSVIWNSPTLPEFQSTRPHGARPYGILGITPEVYISIHAPTRGATAGVLDTIQRGLISIHAPTRGATFIAMVIIIFKAISIHAPTRGATFIGNTSLKYSDDFNPRAHTGRDTVKEEKDEYTNKFQSTRPHGARPVPMAS